MRVKQYLRWELLLALSLVGCTSVVPNRIGLPQQPATGAAEVREPVAPAGLNLGTRLLFQVRWPAQSGYGAQTIPGETANIEVKVVKGGLDPEAAAHVVASDTLVRPAGTDTSTATFNLDPALKQVDVHVRALSAGGAVLANGKHLGVPVRDNTSTGVTVSLIPTAETAGAEAELQLRLTNHLRLLGDLPAYFKDYDQLARYSDSTELRDLVSSLQTTFGDLLPSQQASMPSVDPGSYPSGDPGTYPTDDPNKPTAYRASSRYTTQSTVTERLYNPSNPDQSMEVVDGQFQKFFWPGHVASVTYTEGALTHGLQADFFPGVGSTDLTTATLRAELSATSWVSEPSLSPLMEVLLDPAATSPVVRPVTFVGGKRPVDATITDGKLGFSIVPQGNSANTFNFGATADTFRDVSNTPLYLALTEKPGAVRQVTVAPKHVTLTGLAPSVAATADVTINDDFLGLKSRTDLRLRRNEGGFGTFVLDLGGSMRLGPIGDHTEPVSGNMGFSLLDPVRKLRLEGSVQIQRIPFKTTLVARFVDVPSNTVIGTIDYELPVDANGRVDMNHLESWPVLKLVDDKNTQFRLTPGFFSGETNGFVRVDVR